MQASKYKGSCHCGAVKYEAEMVLDKTMECNCSICSKRGSLLSFTPIDKLKVVSGEGNLTEYLWNKKKIHHLFCKTCGILPFAKATGQDGTKMAAINIRTLDDTDISKVPVTHFDGKSI